MVARRRPWLFVDAGIDVLGDAGFGQKRAYAAVGRSLSPRTAPHVVAGPLCMKGDVFTRAAVLPRGLRAGDWVLIGGAGAYGFSRASWFGGRLPSIYDYDELRPMWTAPLLAELSPPEERPRAWAK